MRLGRNQKDIQKHFKVSRGRAYYMVKNARDVTKAQLDRYLNRLSDLDVAIKSGKTDKQLGLEMFLLQSV
jgi:DNA polymerase-3 subunit delta